MFSKTNLNGQKAGPPSIISINLHVKGDLKSEGEIQIDGSVDGNVTALSITIGENGSINGEIIAGKILIRGKVKGEIHSQEVQLSKSAHVIGDIHHDILGIESGAYVEGLCKRSKRPIENAENKTKSIKTLQINQNTNKPKPKQIDTKPPSKALPSV
ncbi:MAG: hypothetical protein CMM49_00485 [Rhodospirillaceae bacterium]|nr:hypothetical protein [Rhodospirillaceae bacterium]|tara:strand:+ start:341 stop:811 length:471 start_codon:yes stop_codon:yes gene_type:complete